jgi:FkbM family methyltransferase
LKIPALHIVRNVLHVVLRSSTYALVSHLPKEWLQWSRSRIAIKDILGKLAINCVLDVGANQGQFGLLLRRMGYRGWILSFEPVQSNLQVLEQVAKRHGPWRVYPYALGAANRRLEINVAELSVFSSFLTPKAEAPRNAPWFFSKNRMERKEEVAVRRLDDVLEACLVGITSPRIYLKMDTQGFDLEVVRGAESVLPSILALQTEVSFKSIYDQMPGFMESIQELQVRGFDVTDFLPVTSAVDQLSAIEMDCIMARSPQSRLPNERSMAS